VRQGMWGVRPSQRHLQALTAVMTTSNILQLNQDPSIKVTQAFLVKGYHNCLPSNWPGFESRRMQQSFILLFARLR
jgi:hypothetical protein